MKKEVAHVYDTGVTSEPLNKILPDWAWNNTATHSMLFLAPSKLEIRKSDQVKGERTSYRTQYIIRFYL